MNAKDAMIEETQRVVLLEDIIDKQAALIQEYEDYVNMLKAMLQRKAT